MRLVQVGSRQFEIEGVGNKLYRSEGEEFTLTGVCYKVENGLLFKKEKGELVAIPEYVM